VNSALQITTADEVNDKVTPKTGALQALYDLIGCHTITGVRITLSGFEHLTMYADDEGLMVEKPVLNSIASALAGTYIVGNVVILGQHDDEGDDTSIGVEDRAGIFALKDLLFS
jgi:hypothetical protein